jgi:hypothetical protein
MAQRDGDVFYHELLDAMAAGGCPLCRLARKASDSYLNALIYEGVVDVGVRETLRNARGPCYRHAWRIARRRGSVLGVSIIYRDVVNTLVKALETQADAPARLFSRGQPDLSRLLSPKEDCPACVLEADATRRHAKTLLKHLSSEEIEAGYIAAGGLCLPHFQAALSHASAGQAKTLAAWQATAWRELRGDLDELIRKHDYRFKGETVTEEEADSWERAVAMLVGDEERNSSEERS